MWTPAFVALESCRRVACQTVASRNPGIQPERRKKTFCLPMMRAFAGRDPSQRRKVRGVVALARELREAVQRRYHHSDWCCAVDILRQQIILRV